MMRSHLYDVHLEGRTVFLRADLNVPHKDNQILDDFRIRALEPTIKLLVEKKARIILATHLDRPQGAESHFSTKLLLNWFNERGYDIHWGGLIQEAQPLSNVMKQGSLLLLENLRFYEGEQNPTHVFAQSLKELADYYVNDAFGVLHRNDCSITLLPALYAAENKTIGLLVEKEITHLEKALNPAKPVALIMGGGKMNDKIPFIKDFLPKIETLILLPALSSTFLKAQGREIGLSLVEDSQLALCNEITAQAKLLGVKLILPEDYLISKNDISGQLRFSNSIPPDGLALSVGPYSLLNYEKALSSSKTIILNGAMGITERPETLAPLGALLRRISQTEAYTIVGGGDSVAAVDRFGLMDEISFCSTGGGAMLYYLTHGTFSSLKALSLHTITS